VKNLTIVGGGTAGWLTALYAQKVYPNDNITLIESEEIGILGAGEGTTPHLVELFDFLDIPFSKLVQNCKSTVKNSIKFTNWNKSQTSYHHPFMSLGISSNEHNFVVNNNIEQETFFDHIYSYKFNNYPKDYVLINKLSNNFLVPFVKNQNQNNLNEIFNFNKISEWSFHLDANLLAKYLKNIGEKRGVQTIEGVVTSFIVDQNNNISKIILKEKEIKTDFVFDCTGFKRLIIGNFYKSKWKSYSNYLPAKKALPFFLPIDKKIPPYTESVAMDYGWMWKIPLQHRYGCGYVFDSDFISDDDAKKELDNYFGFEIDSPKTFSFNAGCYKKIWINNCLAVGLSSGFIEPLEATSLWQLYRVLKRFFSSYSNIKNNNKNIVNNFNKQYLNDTKNIVEFIYLHYITDKDNTIFWKNFTINNEKPKFIEKILNIIKEKPLTELDFNKKNDLFDFYNYSYILVGNNIITRDILKKYLSLIKTNHEKEYLNILLNQKNIFSKCMNHNKFLEILSKQ
jgi:tryptophan halogenase